MLMKTLLALLLLSASCFAQSIQDIEKTKVRMRIELVRYTPEGSLCNGSYLIKNKLGREVPDKPAGVDPFAGGVATAGAAHASFNIIDMVALKPGEVKDVTLYPVAGASDKFALSAASVARCNQGQFHISITPEALARMSFEVRIYDPKPEADGVHCKAAPMMVRHTEGKPDVIREAFESEFQAVIKADPAAINQAPKFKGVPQVKLFPTAKTGVYALTAADAVKTWVVNP